MPECHKCDWNNEPPTDAKTRACVACAKARPTPYLTNKGRVHVSLDSGSAQTAAEVEASLQRDKAEAEAELERLENGGTDATGLHECCQRTAIELLDYLGKLSEREIKLVVAAAHGMTLAEAAEGRVMERRRGNPDKPYTRAMLSKVWRDILAKAPELGPVLEKGKMRTRARSVPKFEAEGGGAQTGQTGQ